MIAHIMVRNITWDTDFPLCTVETPEALTAVIRALVKCGDNKIATISVVLERPFSGLKPPHVESPDARPATQV